MSEEPARSPRVMAVRAAWSMLLLVAAVLTAFAAWGPIPSLGCSKIGQLDVAGAPSDATCDSSVVHVLGVWPIFGIGVLLCAPAAIAAVYVRQWISWLAFAAYVFVGLAGLVNWTGWMSLLVDAAPMALAALPLAIAHRFLPSRKVACEQLA